MDTKTVEAKMQTTVEHLQEEFKTVRTGRANAGLVENMEVVYYDQRMPLKALASITTPDAKTITVAPWDPNAVSAVEKALREDDKLQLNPISDGKIIHIQVPPPTSERRQQLVKQVGELAEEARVSLRNARHEALKQAQKLLKDKDISENEFDTVKSRLDELVQEYGDKVEELAETKKQEVEEV